MIEFKQGFFVEAEQHGLPEKQAAHMWKRALDYPGTESMLKELNVPDEKASIAPELQAAQLEQLSEIIQQQKIQQEIANLKNQLGV